MVVAESRLSARTRCAPSRVKESASAAPTGRVALQNRQEVVSTKTTLARPTVREFAMIRDSPVPMARIGLLRVQNIDGTYQGPCPEGRRMLPLRRVRPFFTAFATTVAACSGSTDIVTPPPPPATGLTLTFVPDSEDVATARALGWQAGLPGLAVTVTPADSSAGPRTFTSAADGTVRIPDLVGGKFVLEASRWLTAAERAKLGAGDDGDGFATRAPFLASASGGAASITVPASRRRSLVISEWAFNPGALTGIGDYQFGGFLELYNNADTTVYLDGMLIAEGFFVASDYPNAPCALYTRYTNDQAGVWSRFMQKFPGTGHEHPLQSGGTVVIATDAIDHRPLFPESLDLSHASFEFTGTGDVDNPAVPNMVDVGLQHYDHGLQWPGLARVAIVALPVEPANLRQEAFPPPQASATYAQIPRSRVLDVLWIRSNYAQDPYAECPRLVGADFDRAGADMRGTDDTVEYQWSLSRRRVPGNAGGPPRLQHTRTGRADFVRTARSPGVPAN